MAPQPTNGDFDPDSTSASDIAPVQTLQTNGKEQVLAPVGSPGSDLVNGKRVLREDAAFEVTANAWSTGKKWLLLTVVAICQTSMNFNAASYSNAVEGINHEFHIGRARQGMLILSPFSFHPTPVIAAYGMVSITHDVIVPLIKQATMIIDARLRRAITEIRPLCRRGPLFDALSMLTLSPGMIAFLVAYAFGCELWAPWSEELGRRWIMQASLLFVNISIIICAFANSFPMMIGGRVLGGLASAGGSVTLGMVADMFHPEDQQYAVLWASLWSCLGAVIGGICGGPIQQYLPWRWIFWVQLIFGVCTQLLHLAIAKETRSSVLLDKEAKRRRKTTGEAIYGPNEVKTRKQRWDWREILMTMWRPYHMLIFEPIVLCLSLLSGFADALIFMFFESYGIVFRQWSFSPTQISLVLITLLVSYFLAYFAFFPIIRRHNARRAKGETLSPETRLKGLLFFVLLLPLGLLGSAFAGTRSWQGMIVCTIPIGMANYAIYYATIDYMVAAYGVYAASATGGNGFARDFLAGICAIYTKYMFDRLGIQNTYLLLFAISSVFCIPVYVFYWKGPVIRKKSKFAEQLAHEKERFVARKGASGEVQEKIEFSAA